MHNGSIIITGGVKRLGGKIADFLSAAGWRVLRTSHEPNSAADIIVDLRKEASEEALLTKAREILGDEEPYALINNAALYKAPQEDTLKVNYLAPKRLSELFASLGKAPKCIINILDAAIYDKSNDEAALARIGFSYYAKSKILLRDWTLQAAKLLAPKARINAIAPGAVLAPEAIHEKAPVMPFPRPQPVDIAKAAEFLLEAQSTTGLIIPVDGGAILWGRPQFTAAERLGAKGSPQNCGAFPPRQS